MKSLVVVATVGLAASWLASGSGTPLNLEGSWVSTGNPQISMNLKVKGSTIEGSGRVLPDSNTDCPAEISMLRVSRSKEQYLGSLRAAGDCTGHKMTLDCEITNDRTHLNCGEQLQFRRR